MMYFKPVGSRSFTLRSVLLQIIHDFPSYGTIPWWHTKYMQHIQFVVQISKVNILWSSENKPTLRQDVGCQKHTHIGYLEWQITSMGRFKHVTNHTLLLGNRDGGLGDPSNTRRKTHFCNQSLRLNFSHKKHFATKILLVA